MKYLLIGLLSISTICAAQNEGNIWLTTHLCGVPTTTRIDFNFAPRIVSEIEASICLAGTNTSVCDENGELLMYTNGIKIVDRYGLILENGDSINAGEYAIAFQSAYPIPQGSFFLREPESTDMYYLFHMFVETTTVFPAYTRFYYSLIDMSQNNGQGKVIEKNIPLLTGNHLLNYNQATTVRHANGRDWWLIIPNHMGPEYYRFLLTTDGIEGPWMQEIGFKEYTTDITASFWGQRTFSPDGSKFADYDFLNYIQVFDFDRCSGLLSNPALINFDTDPVINNGPAGVSFSPSGRFLYITRANNGLSLFQYDLEADNIMASEIEIDHCPLVNQQFECAFTNILLAPDNKIYIAGDTISYHVIHEPDSLGMACDLERGGLVFPLAYPNSWFPYFPNYRLGALEGSVCDSLVSSSGEVALAIQDLQVSPNPASSSVEISFSGPSQPLGKQAILVLYNQLGQAVAFNQVGATLELPHRIDVSNLPPGLYNVALQLEGTLIGTARFMVER